MAEGIREIAFDRFRRTTARRMTESVTTKPQVTLHRTIELTAIEAGLDAAKRRHPDARLGLSGALVAGIARGLKSSRINGIVADEKFVLHDAVHMGVAVDVDGALVVPVIRNADQLSVAAIGEETRRLADLAHQGGLRIEHMDGATFTISSLGPMGVESFTPIINPPQLAILGLGAARTDVASRDGEVACVRRMSVSLSFDHAATDGAEAARALDQVCRTLEAPDMVAWVEDDGRAPKPPPAGDPIHA